MSAGIRLSFACDIHCVQSHVLCGGFQVGAIAQQEPVRLFDYPPCRLVMAQRIGGVHTHPADHLAAVFGHHVEQVVDHTGLGTVPAHF